MTEPQRVPSFTNLRNKVAALVVDEEASTAAMVFWLTPEWKALVEWLEFHGIDPHLVPLGIEITRDAVACQIRYQRFVVGDDGTKAVFPPTAENPDYHCAADDAVEQGEAPPLPLPDIVDMLMRPVGRHA